MKDIIEILEKIRSDVDYKKEEHLISDEIITSFDIITLVAELNSKFDIDITAKDVVPENFESAKAIKDLVDRLK